MLEVLNTHIKKKKTYLIHLVNKSRPHQYHIKSYIFTNFIKTLNIQKQGWLIYFDFFL